MGLKYIEGFTYILLSITISIYILRTTDRVEKSTIKLFGIVIGLFFLGLYTLFDK